MPIFFLFMLNVFLLKTTLESSPKGFSFFFCVLPCQLEDIACLIRLWAQCWVHFDFEFTFRFSISGLSLLFHLRLVFHLVYLRLFAQRFLPCLFFQVDVIVCLLFKRFLKWQGHFCQLFASEAQHVIEILLEAQRGWISWLSLPEVCGLIQSSYFVFACLVEFFWLWCMFGEGSTKQLFTQFNSVYIVQATTTVIFTVF